MAKKRTEKPATPKAGKPKASPAAQPTSGASTPAAEPPVASANSRPKHIGGKFKPGVSGNPQGKKPGTVNHVNRLIRQRLHENAEAIVSALIERACKGSTDALALALERICPPMKYEPREPFDIGSLDSMGDCVVAQRRVAHALAAGGLDDDNAAALQRQIDGVAKLLTSGELVTRLERIEQRLRDHDSRGGPHAAH